MEKTKITRLRQLYETTLFDDVIPFWMKYSPDREYGGYLTMLDRDGTPYGTDKYMWPQAREVWFFSTLCHTVEKRPEWLDMAKLGWDFIVKHAFHESGRSYFSFKRDGAPLTMPRQVFSETFIIIAAVRYALVTGDQEAARIARTLYKKVVEMAETPAAGSQKAILGARSMSAHNVPMILLNVTREMTLLDGDTAEFRDIADRCLEKVLKKHLHPERKLLFENVAPDGSLMLDIPEGRLILPGHAIESAWFLMHEGMARNDRSLIGKACDLTLWMLDFGWDIKYDGLLYFLDSEGFPPLPLEWDMKLWWCHNEALYALLLAHHLTGEKVYESWYDRVHEYSFTHFPDPVHGEWFGYLHRDGTVSHRFKGSTWKGCFHLPRHLLYCWQLLLKMEKE
ncbi:MAG: AGE family epimerase/isomerase [Candidatus Latescibacter sp.]|nr:AGE family epimerase/isomerase [Candidatus Latescibacter sp.]